MRRTRRPPVTEYQLITSWDHLRRELSAECFADRLDRPLAYWALTSDRGLPRVFLERPLRQILGASFKELWGTPGIGNKKLGLLFELLSRASDRACHNGHATAPAEWPVARNQPLPGEPGFDAALVSESQWEAWRRAVIRHGLQQLPLGRWAVSLESIPRVMWNKPLKDYLDVSLAELRSLPAHGEKRVQVVVETFGIICSVLGDRPRMEHLDVAIAPKFAAALEAWLGAIQRQRRPPSVDEVRSSLVAPLLEQIRTDLGDDIARLVEGRLVIQGNRIPVQIFAQRRGLSRARIYQLLLEVSMMLHVRWPDGMRRMVELCEWLEAIPGTADARGLLRSMAALFSPSEGSDRRNSRLAHLQAG